MEKELKIAFLNMTQGRVERGAEVFVRELAERLGRKHKVEVIGGRRRLPERWPVLWRVFLDAQGLMVLGWSLTKIPKIWRERYNVVVPINGGWQVAMVRLVTWVYGGKAVVSGQSGMGWNDRNNLWAFPNCFVAISSRAARWAKRVNPWVKVEYIPNGVDLNKFKPEGEKYKVKLKRPIVLGVGALIESKRMEVLIEAVSKISEASLLVVGEGPLEQKLAQMGKDLLGGRFQLISVGHDEMPRVYRAADIFALVSWEREAFGIVYVEAMACGLGVVASDDEQRREIVGEAGILVKNPNDIDEVTGVIEKALKRKWGNKPREQAEKFGWEEIAKKYEELFLKL